VIFKSSIIKITIIQTLINFCFSWGYWGLTSWLPVLLAEKGLSTGQGLGFLALSALFMFLGYISANYFTGRFRRKKVMVSYVPMATIADLALRIRKRFCKCMFGISCCPSLALALEVFGIHGLGKYMKPAAEDKVLRGVS